MSDIYDRITDQIIAAIETSAATQRFEMPWHNCSTSNMAPINVQSGKPYRGINTLALWAAATVSGYESGRWATYPQWQALGAQVKKGEKSTLVVFWKAMPAKDDGARGESGSETAESDPANRRFLARAYSVFNAQQVQGDTPPVTPTLSDEMRIERAEHFFAKLGGEVRHGGFQACYVPSQDRIDMPDFKCFVDNISYYSTLAHEYVHWSGHWSRLDRDLSGRFGTNAYAAEELVAELGAAFCCATLNLSVEPRDDHAKYLSSWLDVLRGDKRAIFTASSKAQQAVDWMQAQQEADN